MLLLNCTFAERVVVKRCAFFVLFRRKLRPNK
nr:MAG TPA: hypothetical protein [Caudoviricetes sp.]